LFAHTVADIEATVAVFEQCIDQLLERGSVPAAKTVGMANG
jgi:hypothetical protein